MKPIQFLFKGAEKLSTYLEPLGFDFRLLSDLPSAGGPVARAEFACGDRAIELHYRYSLIRVCYKIGDRKLEHDEYVSLLDKTGQNKYPNASRTGDAFACLKYDLKQLLIDFTEQDAIIFRQKIAGLNSEPNRSIASN